MNINPLVSVIIPTYNRADRLTMAIDSVLAQTYKHIEIIVVDDNNPKTSARIQTSKLMEKYIDEDRVNYIKHEKNKNGAAARNTGIKNSKGKYITFLDDDDLYYPEKVHKQVEFLEKNYKYNGVYCGRVQNGKVIISKLEGDLSECILTQTFTPTTPALMFRSNILKSLGGFDESFRRHQDYEMLLRFFRGNSIGAIEIPLVEIGVNEGENALHGEELEKMKENFLRLFTPDICTLEDSKPGIKKIIYISHYRGIMFDHIGEKFFKKAFYIYLKGCRVSIFKFNIELFKYLVHYICYRYNKYFRE